MLFSLVFAKPHSRRSLRSGNVEACQRSDVFRKSLRHNLLSDPRSLNLYAAIFYKNGAGRRGPVRVADHPSAPISPLCATLMDLPASVANKNLTAELTLLAATLTQNPGRASLQTGSVPKSAGLKTRHYRRKRGSYLRPRLDFMRISGQRAKMEVVKPPRGVNSPRTTHHSGRTAATMSRRILLTAFS